MPVTPKLQGFGAGGRREMREYKGKEVRRRECDRRGGDKAKVRREREKEVGEGNNKGHLKPSLYPTLVWRCVWVRL